MATVVVRVASGKVLPNLAPVTTEADAPGPPTGPVPVPPGLTPGGVTDGAVVDSAADVLTFLIFWRISVELLFLDCYSRRGERIV